MIVTRHRSVRGALLRGPQLLAVCLMIGMIGGLAPDAAAQTLLGNPNTGKNVLGGTGPLAPPPTAPVAPLAPPPTGADPKGGPEITTAPAPAPAAIPTPPPAAPVTAAPETDGDPKTDDTVAEAPAPPAPEAPASSTTADASSAPAIAAESAEAPESGAPPAPTPPTLPIAAGGTNIARALATLAAGLPEGEAESFAALLVDVPEGVTGDTFGHLLYARRHFDRAAWFFGAAAQSPGGTAASLNNFGALVMEVYADAPETWPDSLLQAGYEALSAANAAEPDTPAILNNLANAARRLGQLEEAVAAARRATELAPEEPLYWTNLARTLDAAGDSDGAAAALARAHLLEPNGLALLETLPALPNAGPAYSQSLQNQCNVNFRCQEICPRSIIGGLMSVTCEIENSSAQLACMEGRPYPTGYRCEEELPEYGILIPGLNAGFSVAVPGFSAHVVVQGDGRVDLRVEAGVSVGPIGGYVRGDGHFSPSGGASFDNLGGGVRVNLLPNSPANQLASDLGHPPVHIEAESLNGQPPQINLETYNAGLVSF